MLIILGCLKSYSMKLLKKYFQSLVRTVFCGERVSKEIKNTENALKALIFLLISNGGPQCITVHS